MTDSQISHEIAKLIESMMKAAYILSPRFDDYKIMSVPVMPDQLNIEQEIEKAVENALKKKKLTGNKTDTSKRKSNAESAENEYFEHIKNYGEKKREEDELQEQFLARLGPDEDGKTINVDELVATNVEKGFSAAKNPLGAAETAVARIPHAALILMAIALAPMIIDELKKPGSALDVRWKRLMIDEFNAFISRQDQWNAQIGQRQLGVQAASGFLQTAHLTELNLRIVRQGGTEQNRMVDQIDFTDHAREFFP